MRQFPLLLEGKPCSFDTDGRVLDSDTNIVGTWNTFGKNLIRVTKAVGGNVDLAVDWLFNQSNQLTISIGGNVLFTIATTVDDLPRYRLDNNVLVVDPDGDGDFEFRLHCLFGMTKEGDLVVSINDKQSVIDGFVEDSKSRFRFQFFDKTMPAFPNSLVFSGEWERKDDNQQILLHFKLVTPALEIAEKPLDLPGQVTVDKNRNHLMLVYQSRSSGERRLQFMGSLQIKNGWTLVFKIDDVKDGGVRKSSIEVEANFEWDRGSGSLVLSVGKTKTATSQSIEIGGTLAAKFHNGSQLTWTFAYKNSTAGAVTTKTIATALTFEFKNGNIFVQYKQDGQAKQVDVTLKLQQSDFTIAGGFQIKHDQQGRGIKSFIGISF